MKKQANQTVPIGEAASILHVSAETLRRYESEGKLPFEVIYTPGGHRKYPLKDLMDFKNQVNPPVEVLIKLPSGKLTDEEAVKTLENFQQTKAKSKVKVAQKELGTNTVHKIIQQFDEQKVWFPSGQEDQDLEIDELYEKYTTVDDKGMSHLPEPQDMTPRLFEAEYDFMAFADLEAPASFEWLAKLREEMARRLDYKGLPGAAQERFMAKKLRQDAYVHFGHEACENVLTFPF